MQFPPQLILFQTQRHLHLVLLFLLLILIQLVQLIQRAIPPSTNFVTNTAAPFSWRGLGHQRVGFPVACIDSSMNYHFNAQTEKINKIPTKSKNRSHVLTTAWITISIHEMCKFLSKVTFDKKGIVQCFLWIFVFDIFRDEIPFPLLMTCSSTIEVHIFQQITLWGTVCSLH